MKVAYKYTLKEKKLYSFPYTHILITFYLQHVKM